MKSLPAKPCEFCHADFVPRRKVLRFCGVVCAAKYRQRNFDTDAHRQNRQASFKKYRDKIVSRNCIECGLPFDSTPITKGICDECKKTRRTRFRPQTFRQCEVCGVTFGPVDHLAVKFCSMKCKGKASAGKPSKLRGQARPNLLRAETRNCLVCGTSFRATKDFKHREQYICAHHCYLKNRRVSSFEVRVFDFLEASGIPVERSVRRGRWSFDGMIAQSNILIEADGAFWHSGDVAKDRDCRKNEWCAANGWELMRVPELLFYKDPQAACSIILARWERATGKTAELITDDGTTTNY